MSRVNHEVGELEFQLAMVRQYGRLIKLLGIVTDLGHSMILAGSIMADPKVRALAPKYQTRDPNLQAAVSTDYLRLLGDLSDDDREALRDRVLATRGEHVQPV